MPRPPKPNDTYDDDAWGGLKFMTSVWNRGVYHTKINEFEYHAHLKEAIRRYHDNIEAYEDLALTIFVEFFFTNRDNGKHRYSITKLQEDGSRTCYYPLPMYAWSSVSPLSVGEISIRLIYGCR